eukprot:Filipodium_phascolosomae@DN2124_c0_g1_i4.p1
MPDVQLLFESAAGYSIFHVREYDEIAQELERVQEATLSASQFKQMVKLKAFVPFQDSEEALSNIVAVVDGQISETLKNMLDTVIPKKKKGTVTLGVCDKNMGAALQELGYEVIFNKTIEAIARGCRYHLPNLIKSLTDANLDRARVGMGHAYSRNKMKFDTNRQDKPIVQTIALIDSLDKNINTFAMRVKEWYSWHFPELAKVVTDNIVFVKTACYFQVRDQWDESKMEGLIELVGSEDVAKEIVSASRTSMGTDIVDADMQNIIAFGAQLVHLAEERKNLIEYLSLKLQAVAPNLKNLIGDTVAARLISHAGSLVSLAKYPASTVQILGAEKALFRALKTRGKTPKYGLLFHSSFIGRASLKNKGRISRYLANKCSLAARIDQFSEEQINAGVFGEKMRDQVEERLLFLADGSAPRKNLDIMREAILSISKE